MVSMASFIYTPYLYPKSDGPRYLTAMTSNACFAFMTIVAAWALRVWLGTMNRRMSREDSSAAVFYAY